MFKKIVLVSPHLDDAVFSCGGLIAALAEKGHALHVITCFTRSVPNPTGFALACQLDKGLSAEVDYMQLRRQEDTNACQLLHAQPHWLNLPEAPHRGYESATALFDGIVEEDTVQPELLARLHQAMEEVVPDLILSPIGIGNHVDHQQVKRAVDVLKKRFVGVPFLYWYDEPYLSRNPALYPAWATTELLPGWEMLKVQATQPGLDGLSITIEPYLEKKMAACAAYTTQLGFQFGGKEHMKSMLAKKIHGRHYYTELVV